MMFEGLTKQPVSLVELCVRKAIDNVGYIGYVGGVEFRFLERILQHCNLEQLKHIEDSTDDTDLSPVTDEFWKRFYKKSFGVKHMNFVVEEMDRREVYYKWRKLYEARLIDLGKKSYKDNDARKLSRQIKLCTKAPPAKKPFWGNSVSKLDLLKSHQVKRKLPPKSSNSLLGTASIVTGERNLPRKSVNSLLGTAPTTSRPQGILPAKRTNSLLGTAPSTSRSIPRGLPSNATPTSRNAGTKRKHAM